MDEDLRASLEAIRKHTPRLNQATDNLAEVVRSVEDFLNEVCRLSLNFSVRIADHNPDEYPEWTNLEYTKIGGRFRIAVVHYNEPLEKSTTTAWSECPRDVKVWAFRCVPNLLTAIAQELVKQSEELERAGNAAREIVDSLRTVESATSGRRSGAEGKR